MAYRLGVSPSLAIDRNGDEYLRSNNGGISALQLKVVVWGLRFLGEIGGEGWVCFFFKQTTFSHNKPDVIY